MLARRVNRIVPTFRNCSYSTNAQVDISKWDSRRRRLLYQSRQRGMKENCILLGQFAEINLQTMNEEHLDQYDRILQEIDPLVLEWITGVNAFPEDLDGPVAQKIKEYAASNPTNYKSTVH
jgi:succinate dehydrogenase flavin-adding protein (antitoxin of CptAB toxin-antitoxin module)